MTGITLDTVQYDVRVVFGSLRRKFAIVEGPNSGQNMMYEDIRDVVGTKYAYSMDVVPNPSNPADYDDFYEQISKPTRAHTVTMPYGQTVVTFDCVVTAGEDTYRGKVGGFERWGGVTVEFTSRELNRVIT